MKNPVALLLTLLLLAGCATTGTIDSRKQERVAAYDALTPEDRALVDAGRIRTGMNEDAVYIAWGKPGQLLEGENESVRSTTWVYYRPYLQDIYFVGSRRIHDAYYSGSYVSAQVVFTNAIVKSWQTFPRPVY